MIRLEAFIDDKKAGKVLHALEGLVIQMTLVPVKNAAIKNGKISNDGTPETAVAAVELAIIKAAKAKHKEINTKTLLTFGETYGYHKAAIMAAIAALKAKKVLVGVERGVYRIAGEK